MLTLSPLHTVNTHNEILNHGYCSFARNLFCPSSLSAKGHSRISMSSNAQNFHNGRVRARFYLNRKRLSLSAFETTDTDESAMAAPANTGLRSGPPKR